MIRFYEGSGSPEIRLLDDRFAASEWQRLKAKTSEFLNRRGKFPAAEFLDRHDFVLKRATNGFCDEFCVLYQSLPMDRYVEALDLTEDIQTRADAESIARAVHEITGDFVRFVVADYVDQFSKTTDGQLLSDLVTQIHRNAERTRLHQRARGRRSRSRSSFCLEICSGRKSSGGWVICGMSRSDGAALYLGRPWLRSANC